MESVTLKELSNAYCLSVSNAYRLIEDAEKVFPTNRLLTVIGLLSMAVREMGRVHLLAKAVTIKTGSSEEWNRFWNTFDEPSSLIDHVLDNVHPNVYRNPEEAGRMRPILEALKENYFETRFDRESAKFVPPGFLALNRWSDKTYAKELYAYALALCKSLNIHGRPDPESQYKLFAHLKHSSSG